MENPDPVKDILDSEESEVVKSHNFVAARNGVWVAVEFKFDSGYKNPIIAMEAYQAIELYRSLQFLLKEYGV